MIHDAPVSRDIRHIRWHAAEHTNTNLDIFQSSFGIISMFTEVVLCFISMQPDDIIPIPVKGNFRVFPNRKLV